MPSVLRYASRQLLKSPGFTLVAILGLALGIGANVALFSVVHSVLIRPLPYHEPDRLVRLSSTNEETNLTRGLFSYSRYLEVQERQQVFSDLALSAVNVFTLTGRGDPEQLVGLHASAALLPALGLEPLLGRNFSADEDRRGGERVALISHAMWQQRFNRDPSVLGQTLTLDGAPYTIIGVLPEAATAFPLDRQQMWVPRPEEVPYLQALNNGGYWFQVIARLEPGVSLEQAREAMNVIAAGYRAAKPGNVDAPSRIEVVPLLEDAVGAERRSYLLLFGAVGCVLLIACANIANLLLARFATRRREIAARFALGASRGEVVLQFVTESMLLAVLGGAAGVLLADWALSALVAFGADLIPRAAEIRIDPIALGFSLLATLVTGLAIGLLPALQASGVNVLDALKDAGRASMGSGPAAPRQPVGRRSVAVAGVAHRRWFAVDELRAAAARGARLRARRRLHRGTGAAAATLLGGDARGLLRAAESTTHDAPRRHVGRVDESRATHRRSGANARCRRGPPPSAVERTFGSVSPSGVATLFQHARDSHSRGTRFRRTR